LWGFADGLQTFYRSLLLETKEERPIKYKTINKFQPEQTQVDSPNAKSKTK